MANAGDFLNRGHISKGVFIALRTRMMDPHRSEYFAILSEAFYPAFFSIADRLGCPEQRYCNGLILLGCVATGNRTILTVYRESSLDPDSPQKRTLHVEGSTAEI